MYKVVSLFDGIGAGRHALNLLNKECEYHDYTADTMLNLRACINTMSLIGPLTDELFNEDFLLRAIYLQNSERKSRIRIEDKMTLIETIIEIQERRIFETFPFWVQFLITSIGIVLMFTPVVLFIRYFLLPELDEFLRELLWLLSKN